MKKFYVVFGLDGSGKTTLIKNFLGKNTDFKYFIFYQLIKISLETICLLKTTLKKKNIQEMIHL